MRVRHSPWSWLKEIVADDSVAGNTLIGMFTRLIFRKPFQVALAAIVMPRPVRREGRDQGPCRGSGSRARRSYRAVAGGLQRSARAEPRVSVQDCATARSR